MTTVAIPAPHHAAARIGDRADATTRALPWLRIGFWSIGVAIALAQAIIYRFWLNGDAMSYIDMSDAVGLGQWSRLINGTWSPLYPFVLGLVAAITRPSPYWQFPVVHFATFLCFLFSFGSFEFLLRAITTSLTRDTRDDAVPLPVWACVAIAYLLFIWGTLGLLTLMKPTPDMLMSGFVFLGLGIVQRMRNGNDSIALYVAFGVTLAFGYFAKAIMFPLGFVLLLMALMANRGPRANARRVGLSLAIFLLLSAPYIVAVSRLTHRLTFSEAATVVHLTYLDKVKRSSYWQGPGGATGTLLHPPRKIFDGLEAYEFDRPIAVTYPLWYDPSYWAAGLRPAFHLGPQLTVLRESLSIYAHTIWETAGLFIVVLVLYSAAGVTLVRRTLLALWPLCVLSLLALAAYALVHVEERYVGAFVTLLWIGLICGIRLPRAVPTRMIGGVVAAVAVAVAVATASQIRRDLDTQLYKAQFQDYEAAVDLQRLGLVRGDHVARINGYVTDGWARLGGFKVTAELRMSTARDFWKASPAVQQEILHAFATVGAKAVVALAPPPTLPPGWQKLGTSRYAVLMTPR